VLVWLFTCLAFGLLHSVNILLGAPVLGTLQQIVLAAAQGSAFYALRRVTGSLIWAMALHGLWDFSVFVLGTSGGSNPLGFLTLVSALVSVIFGFLATKDAVGQVPADVEPVRT
jgi:membrane protease YdiL (CAAX protease family)